MHIKEYFIHMYNSLDVVYQDVHCYSQVAEVPFDKFDFFVQYLQDNVPPGVTVHMELVRKWRDAWKSPKFILIDW